MIRSMTAFAKAETVAENLTVEVEVRTYNHRHLDFSVRVPHGYGSLEEKIKGLIAGKVSRGRVELKLNVKDTSEAVCGYAVDGEKADAYVRALSELKERFGIEKELSLDLLATAGGIITAAQVEKDLDAQWEVISATVDKAVAGLNGMRQVEGDHLAADFSARLDLIEETVSVIERESEGLVAKYRDRLMERIAKLTGGLVEIDEGRIAQEAAFLADRSDIDEEIVRARSHVKQFREIMTSSEPGGRKLNFLLQEFNREFNTMGSKTGNTDVSHRIVAVKSELEKLREQVQNVE